ncbi:MAG: CehA/McbA family metallohydrolase, partial [Myxococcota bacterium]|nr:CehA/McbA family metallohydrolase [Myxococcota bacterium]
PARARVDRFAEREARLNLFVDGDGDGVDALVEDGARLDVAAGPTAHVVLRWPSTAAPRAQAPLTVACLDRHWNAVTDCALELRLEALEGDARPPARVALTPDDAGSVRVAVALGGPGVHVLRARGPDGQVADSNPLLALPRPPRLLWGDLHGHSNLSDGTGTPEDYFRYARDVAALDVVALTDHDHIGFPALDRTPAHWERIRRAVEGFHEPGRFVALLGYEWTSWIHGHRHVLFFGDGGEVVSSADPRTESPLALWDALRGRPALTFAHHSAGGPIATNWAIPPDPELEPVTEIVSVHGSSESIDTPNPVHRPVRGNFVREALARGYRLGFVGSGDGHDGHPGLTRLGRPATGGLAGLWSESLTRDGAREALRARRVYATNGPRLLLRVTLDDAPMGALLPPAAERRLSVLVVGDGKLERIDVVRGRRVVHQVPGERRRRVGFSHTLRRLDAGEWVYVRAVQTDGGAAWSSPFFVEGPR